MLQNLHTHTVFCDGINTVEEMCESAIRLGFDSLGFSSHSPTEFNLDEEIKDMPQYISAVRNAQQKYGDRLKIYLGCELDAFTLPSVDRAQFDYTIASTHGAFKNGKPIYFDYSYELALSHVRDDFGGNGLLFAELYFETLLTMKKKIGGDFVGHFDLVSKFSEMDPSLINVESKEYKTMALDTLRTLRRDYDLFEVNTGAISRNYRTRPYPAPFILDEMKNLRCKLLLTSDCHNATYLDVYFKESVEYILSHGFTELYYLTDTGFVPEKIK